LSRIVVAFGGNALLPDGSPAEGGVRPDNVALAADVVSALAHHALVVTHGSGPQVGRLALQAEMSGNPDPLDLLEAGVEGMVGYLFEREIRSRLPHRPVATLITQVEVDTADPAFDRPTKPIGPKYDRATAEQVAAARGWTVSPEGPAWRRVVPSPRPHRVLEIDAVNLLLAAGHIVVCGGGGGIPVSVCEDGTLVGVEGVVDKDHVAALLALGTGADTLLLLTDVPAVFRDWPERQDPIGSTTTTALRALDLPAGSMRPKVEAAITFVEGGGKSALIGVMEDALAMVAGVAGTRVTRG
jgi:carbamate kinase